MSPGRIFFGKANHQLLDFSIDRRAPYTLSLFRAIELLRDEFPEPGQHRLWLENGTDFSERFLAKPLSDLRQSDSFLIGEFESPLDLGPEDFIPSGQVFVPQLWDEFSM